MFVVLAMLPGVPLADGIADTSQGIRGSITIRSDADFTTHWSVRQGAGTAEDPFVIAGWDIVRDEPWGILLEGTDAHVVIEDVGLHGQRQIYQRCRVLLPYDEKCRDSAELILRDASNATVRDITIEETRDGMRILGSRNILVEDVAIRSVRWRSAVGLSESENVTFDGLVVHNRVQPNVPDTTVDDAVYRVVLGNPEIWGFNFWSSTNVTARNLEFTAAGFNVYGMANFSVEDSSFTGVPQSTLTFGVSSDVVLRNNTLTDAHVHWLTALERAAFLGNQFTGSGSGIATQASSEWYSWPRADLLVCGNAFDGGRTLYLDSTERGRVIGNTFTGAGMEIAHSADVEIRQNRVVDAYRAVHLEDTEAARVNWNHIEASWGLYAPRVGYPVNATLNWWGHETGPGGDGPGLGSRVLAYDDPVDFDPWLTEPPAVGPDAVDCAAELASWPGNAE